jgi:DnaJ-class molecular chaperone
MVNKELWVKILGIVLVFGMILMALGSCNLSEESDEGTGKNPVKKAVTCSVCDGTGKCQNCGGDGKVALLLTCSVCKGTGKCQNCNGTGYASN